ncbi:unnamed protein product [Protopolystoma xenopodis]|uniref:Uncharacterized protein n=1 Tax=Protopolystoma xenopodis TaxID=117903 RepID=A0A448XFQ7_9PLAT|nr:unnamed protein product [Protopolystoma xenopodis]
MRVLDPDHLTHRRCMLRVEKRPNLHRLADLARRRWRQVPASARVRVRVPTEDERVGVGVKSKGDEQMGTKTNLASGRRAVRRGAALEPAGRAVGPTGRRGRGRGLGAACVAAADGTRREEDETSRPASAA